MRVNYRTIFLDMNGTIMFDANRLDPAQDFYSTYVRLGGGGQEEGDVARIVQDCVRVLYARYSDPAFYDRFPSVGSILRRVVPGMSESELELLEEVIAVHELGRVPETHAERVRELSRHYGLVLVSNLWSRKRRWLGELESAGILGLFEHTVFSSDEHCVKPSFRFFERALEVAGRPRSEVLVVGDSLDRDIAGATAAGLDSAWISGGELPSDAPQPTYHFSTLRDLIP